jgi:hypothetical protein
MKLNRTKPVFAPVALLVGLLPVSGEAATFNIANGDVAGLIAAIQTANTNGEENVINLAPKGTYTLTAVSEYPAEYAGPGAAGLPLVRSVLTINGNGASIQRSTAAGTPDFVVLGVSARTVACPDPDGCGNVSLTLNQATITGGSYGGMHVNGATALVQGSTITQNTGAAGLTSVLGRVTVVNSTISYNTSPNGYGGGGLIHALSAARDYLHISFSTIFENYAYGTGDALATAWVAPGRVVIKNSILASPTRASTRVGTRICWISNDGAIVSQGHNIGGDGSCSFTAPGDVNNTNPLLAPIADNGGPSPTYLLPPGSPAIDAVPLSNCTDISGNPVVADQRGVARPQGTACDIGSVEVVKHYVCLLYDPAKPVPGGATDPIKLMLCDAAGMDTSTPDLTLQATSVTWPGASAPPSSRGNANPNNQFRFDPTLGTSGGYQFNLSTAGLPPGSYNLNFTVGGNPTNYTAPFRVK